ncbi:DUF3592 domain-containing protein [Streptomyces sp. NPDC058067]|uniref:DUF3592 domain-containing protein n=1 Tax=Streptomyces sp. NPDC058067 TaxID=3346324 RepID=UPI0036E7C77E
MYGAAIPVAVLAALVLVFAARIYARGRALRVRGVRVAARCVNLGNGPNGTMYLRVRFAAGDGEREASIGPFAFPPARIGEPVTVVYDPRDLGNVETPDQMTTGRVALACAVLSVVALALSGAALWVWAA